MFPSVGLRSGSAPLRQLAKLFYAAQPPPPGAAAVRPENAAKPASTLRTMEELHAEVGADGLALVMSIGAAAEHESAQGAALMVLGDEGALDALLYPLAAGAQPHSALHSPVLRVARPTLCLSLLLSLCVRSVLC
jgi:hypothetical protein